MPDMRACTASWQPRAHALRPGILAGAARSILLRSRFCATAKRFSRRRCAHHVSRCRCRWLIRILVGATLSMLLRAAGPNTASATPGAGSQPLLGRQQDGRTLQWPCCRRALSSHASGTWAYVCRIVLRGSASTAAPFRVMPIHLYSSKQQCCRFSPLFSISRKSSSANKSASCIFQAPQVSSGCNHAHSVYVPADGVREGTGPGAEEGEETCSGGTRRAGAQAQAEKEGWARAAADARPRQVCVFNASNTRGRLYAGWTFLSWS